MAVNNNSKAVIKNIYYFSDGNRDDFEEFCRISGIAYKRLTNFCFDKHEFDGPEQCPDLLIFFADSQGFETDKLNKNSFECPFAVVAGDYKAQTVLRYLQIGAADVFPSGLNAKQWECEFARMQNRYVEELNNESFLQEIRKSEKMLMEKNAILETILDIL